MLGAKLIGLSCNTTESHHAWSKDVLANMGVTSEDSLAFPIIADADRDIVSTLGMLDPEEKTAEGIPLPARALVILHGTTVKLTILYPATTGRNFEEVKRILTSLQLTASNGLATPVDWQYGDKLIVGPAVKTEDAQAKFEDFNIESLPSGKQYLRTVRCLELTTDMTTTPPTENLARPPPGPNPLKIGATIPNFSVSTTQGNFELHRWLTADPATPWTIFFTHPKDFTPVCTTELGACHKLAGQAAQLGCKLIGLSCDDTESHHAWSKDVLARAGCAGEDALAFPIIADSDRSIVTKLGMLDPEERDAAGVPLPARALLILNGTTVKLTILYPATTGRNFDEVLRTLVSLQLTANSGLATPVDWKYGERVIVGPAVKTEDALIKFTDLQIKELPSGKPYLRSVMCPDAGIAAP
jgi:1-Cys peroxiredoxin 6